jgi:glucose uptake protein GlcU
MGEVYFHDNTAIDAGYGVNIDSWDNDGVRLESNHIIHPRQFGIVVGGEQKFTNFKILNNVVQLDKAGLVGIVFRGNVTGALVMGNTILAENPAAAKSTAIRSYSGSRTAPANRNNMFQSNQIAAGLKIAFEGGSQKSQSCFAGNHDEHGRAARELADNHNGPCTAGAPSPKAP